MAGMSETEVTFLDIKVYILNNRYSSRTREDTPSLPTPRANQFPDIDSKHHIIWYCETSRA